MQREKFGVPAFKSYKGKILLKNLKKYFIQNIKILHHTIGQIFIEKFYIGVLYE